MLSYPTLGASSPSNHLDLVPDVIMISENAGKDNFSYEVLHEPKVKLV
jgi:hypothetical protein